MGHGGRDLYRGHVRGDRDIPRGNPDIIFPHRRGAYLPSQMPRVMLLVLTAAVTARNLTVAEGGAKTYPTATRR